MKFSTHEERMKHPQASMIPESLWSDNGLFYYELSDEEIHVMKANNRQIMSGVDAQNYRLEYIYRPFSTKGIRAWLAIVLSHPTLDHKILLNVATQLNLDEKDLLTAVAAWGNLDFFESLIMRSDIYLNHLHSAFNMAAKCNHLNLMKKILEIIPEKQLLHLTEDLSLTLSGVAAKGHLDIAKFIINLAPDKIQVMEGGWEPYSAFYFAADNGHLSIMQYLMEQLPPQRAQKMIEHHYFNVLDHARINNHRHVINWLLQFPSLFAHTESHVREYSTEVHPFITSTLAELHVQKADIERDNPDAVFDIRDPEKTKLYFYFVRNLIRRYDAENPESDANHALQDEILFLLNIPSVKAIAHTAINPHERDGVDRPYTYRGDDNPPNELLRLALRVGNQPAAAVLLNIPEVQRLAEANNYYPDEAHGRLNLRELAQDRESSMHALSTGEQRRLKSAITKYEPQIKKIGASEVIAQLKKELHARYLASQPVITRVEADGRTTTIKLPLNWEEFTALNLNGEERERALKAYYQNKDHTAFRYLSRPNPWMHPGASYVNVNPDNTTERWSTFDEYQPLIAILYTAAKDTSVPAIDGYTIETRFERFIDEIAHIGRAHNWDKSRDKIGANGERILEEYDDLEGDRPSCFSGVKRRLFQSVLGHPLLKMLTKETITEEIRYFVRHHLQSLINDSNRLAIKIAWNKFIGAEETSDDDLALLKTLDIPQKKQKQFIAFLGKKYGAQFKEDREFDKQIQQAFALQSDDAHVLNFGHIHWEQLLEEGVSIPLANENEYEVELLEEVVTSNNPTQVTTSTEAIREPNALIIESVFQALTNYQQWWKEGNTEGVLRGPDGFFSRSKWLMRHGEAGQQRAQALYERLNKPENDLASLITEINNFLVDPKTNYHIHSFASFLLDELRALPNQPWSTISLQEDERHYNKKEVLEILSGPPSYSAS